MKDHFSYQAAYEPTSADTYVRNLERLLDEALQNQAALVHRCAAQAHEIARLTLALADRHAPSPEPSPATLDAIRAMQRSGIR